MFARRGEITARVRFSLPSIDELFSFSRRKEQQKQADTSDVACSMQCSDVALAHMAKAVPSVVTAITEVTENKADLRVREKLCILSSL